MQNKDFTEYTDKELHDWFKSHIIGWSGHAVGPKENFEVVIAEMQRRYIIAQNKTNDTLLKLTKVLAWLTFVLVALAILQFFCIFK